MPFGPSTTSASRGVTGPSGAEKERGRLSATFEVRRALLEEGHHALDLVGGAAAPPHGIPLGGEGLLEGQMPGADHRVQHAGCGTIFTEDLAHGSVLAGVRVQNPFVTVG